MPRTPGEWGTNSGHGHVWKRPDGSRARCGGPSICSQCALDAKKYPAHRLELAHTAANKIDGLGFDGDKAIELLPKYLMFFANHEVDSTDRDRYLYDFMQAISGKKDGE